MRIISTCHTPPATILGLSIGQMEQGLSCIEELPLGNTFDNILTILARIFQSRRIGLRPGAHMS